jgi:predicted porin
VSDGPYFRSEAQYTLPPGRGIGDYRELVLGQDASFAWHHLQVWAEVYEARFEVPRVGNADTLAYYLEAKYKFTPQFFGALRWNQQLFSKVDTGAAGKVRWGNDLGRVDVAAGYRFTPHTQLKLQYSFQQETSGPGDTNHLFAAQLTVRF